MAFFGKSLVHRKIDINIDSTSADSPEVRQRLDRIESNYSRLNEIFAGLEARFELDDRLAAARTDADDLQQIKKKPR